MEATVLPGLLGFTALGLLGRAQSLFGITIGRVNGILIETVYPLLPRYATDLQQYQRQAVAFVQIALLVAIPGALFLGTEGPTVSRLLYGQKWSTADPLLWPGALFGPGDGSVLAEYQRARGGWPVARLCCSAEYRRELVSLCLPLHG